MYLSECVQMLLLLLQIPLALLNELINRRCSRRRNWRRNNDLHWWRGNVNHIFGAWVVHFYREKEIIRESKGTFSLLTKYKLCDASFRYGAIDQRRVERLSKIERDPKGWSCLTNELNPLILYITCQIVSCWSSLLLHTLLLLHSKLALVVAEVFSPKKEGELWVVLLFFHCHFFKLRAIPSNKLGQLINDIPQLLICTKGKKEVKKIVTSNSKNL